MSVRLGAKERARRRAAASMASVGRDLLHARELAGLSRQAVADACGVSESAIRRLEGGNVRTVMLERLAVVAAGVGLDLGLRLYPTGAPIRDAGHNALLERLRQRLHPGLVWRTEVPLPQPSDLRAWDAGIWLGRDWRPVDAETRLTDLQALEHRTNLKLRDSGTDRVILLVADTRNNRAAIRAAPRAWTAAFPVGTRAAMRALGEGRLPEGSALIVL